MKLRHSPKQIFTSNVEFPSGELSGELLADFRYTLGFLPTDSQQAPSLVASSMSLWKVSEPSR